MFFQLFPITEKLMYKASPFLYKNRSFCSEKCCAAFRHKKADIDLGLDAEKT